MVADPREFTDAGLNVTTTGLLMKLPTPAAVSSLTCKCKPLMRTRTFVIVKASTVVPSIGEGDVCLDPEMLVFCISFVAVTVEVVPGVVVELEQPARREAPVRTRTPKKVCDEDIKRVDLLFMVIIINNEIVKGRLH